MANHDVDQSGVPTELASGEHLPMRHAPDPGLPDGFPVPTMGERPYEVDVHHVGPEGWTGYWPPEDSALYPPLEWTEAHRILVLAAYNQVWGQYLDEGQTYEIRWPPTAHLYTAGHINEAVLYSCAEHEEGDCDVCETAPPALDEIHPAEWRWQAHIELYEWKGTSGTREDTDTFHFMTTFMDPRDVDYANQ